MKDETNETISENFSEKVKRGRPRLIQPEFEKRLREEKPYADTRTLHNENYESRAVMALGLSPNNPPDFPFLWLGDVSKLEFGFSKRRGYRKTILAELGRIDDNKNLIEAATEVCRLKPKTQDAIKMIRSWRMHRSFEPPTLESTLRKAIADYQKQNPDVSDNEVSELLDELKDDYSLKAIFRK